ncbi:Xaa-Pro peptidase family protein [Xanthobacteraceae bacterium Astr-EGSB]|uniref:M24 family metallopeptidase n=1 Tax=Astrobacterium formosum TaxID=3069710 RepID=UPI0027B4E015|nr:Xaa-Pro peptidase family protein [Xanthobacteraceae bacterium Astr-EGSB]
MNQATSARETTERTIPFETEQLDRLMDQAGFDILLATSKHNIQYLTGGHRSQFFETMDAIALTRFLPVFVYRKGAPREAVYIGHRLEASQLAATSLWVGDVRAASTGTVDAVELAAERVDAGRPLRVGIEKAFLPVDAAEALAHALPKARFVDATWALERLRARKSAYELKMLREASDRVVDAMLAVMATQPPGAGKRAIVDALRHEEAARGLNFDYCLITAGRDLNRAPSEARWEAGETLSLDSGGNYHGYIGDVCRMAVHGGADQELVDLLAEVEAVQQAAFASVRPGAPGRVIHAQAGAALERCRHREHMHFIAHGMGLVTHEAPRLSTRGPVPYPDEDSNLPLEPGMVVSVETTLRHPRRGFVKLEDTVAVTAVGHELFGDRGRGWNRGGG